MRQQTLENQLRDMRQLLDEALVELEDCIEAVADTKANGKRAVEARVEPFRQRADEIMAR